MYIFEMERTLREKNLNNHKSEIQERYTNPEQWSLDVFYQMSQSVNGTLILDHQQVVNTRKETFR